jgi:hypothetical protein
MPLKETLDKVAYTCMLSSSLTSVSIFSVCCYSIVSISVIVPDENHVCLVLAVPATDQLVRDPVRKLFPSGFFITSLWFMI